MTLRSCPKLSQWGWVFVSLHLQYLEVGHPITESVTSGGGSSQSSEPLAASIPEAGDECVDPEEGLWAENHTTAPMRWLPRVNTWHRKCAYSLPWWSCLAALSQRDLQHCLFSFNYRGYAPFHSNRRFHKVICVIQMFIWRLVSVIRNITSLGFSFLIRRIDITSALFTAHFFFLPTGVKMVGKNKWDNIGEIFFENYKMLYTNV